ncbi:hypothetical protein DS957_004010 [Vibrio harveyi]|uniref:Uncharacterized protein n=1 Tax=Vibrio harveyi TaxID=669 RepID=A0A8B3DKA0_VIBHA|nr:hypothetical protein DS957_004010 [Vibrio harveyi]
MLAIQRSAFHNGATQNQIRNLHSWLINMNNSVNHLLPASLVAEIAQRTKQTTTSGIAQACMCHLIDTNEDNLIKSGLTLIKLKKYVRALNI